MEFLQLKYFQTVARLEHMTKAAEELQITQPSLSKTIARLEEDLGVSLFDRQGRNIRLSTNGRVFLDHVNRAFLELDLGIRKVQDLAGRKKVSITIAMTLPKILHKIVSPFLNQYPYVHFQQIMEPPSILKKKLENGEIDLCISPLIFESPIIEWNPLFTEEINLIVPTDHYLAGRKSIRLSEVKNETFILMNNGFCVRELTDKLCNEAGFTPNITMEVNDPEAIIALIRRGKGVSFISERDWKYVAHLLPERIRINEPNSKQTIGLSCSTKKNLSIEALQFKQHVFKFFENA